MVHEGLGNRFLRPMLCALEEKGDAAFRMNRQSNVFETRIYLHQYTKNRTDTHGGRRCAAADASSEHCLVGERRAMIRRNLPR
jgi:hypothetical protein